MADEVDQAEAIEAAILSRSIEAARTAGRELRPVLHCHWCGEPVGELRLFCDADCATDHHKHNKNKRGADHGDD